MHKSKYFGNIRHPFLVTLAGEQLCVLTSPEDVAAVFKNVDSFTFDGFVRDVMVSFGASSSGVEKMCLLPGKDGLGHVATALNPSKKCLAQLARDFHRLQLHPGHHQAELSDKFLYYISQSLHWELISAATVVKDGEQLKQLSLKRWCGDVLLKAATKAFFGELLLEIQPDLLDKFFDFDDDSWMVMFRVPRVFAKSMYRCKNTIIRALVKYFQTPRERRRDAAWYVQTMETEQRRLGIDDRDIATLTVMVYWV